MIDQFALMVLIIKLLLIVMITTFPNNRAFFPPCLCPLLLLSFRSPRWLTVLAAGSKPAVHLMSNVLYHSPLSRLSDLAAALVRRHAWLSSRHVLRLSLALSRNPASTWPMKSPKGFSIQFIIRFQAKQRSTLTANQTTPCNVIGVAGAANPTLYLYSILLFWFAAPWSWRGMVEIHCGWWRNSFCI